MTAITTAAVLGLTLAACASGDGGQGGADSSATGAQADDGRDMLETNGPEVLTDADGSGLDVSSRFFESADAVVVTDADYGDQLAAATAAIDRSVPMVEFTGTNGEAVTAEVQRLGADTVYSVGDLAGVDFGETTVEPIEGQQAPEGDDSEMTETPNTTEATEEVEGEGAPAPVDEGTTVDIDTSPGETTGTTHEETVDKIAELESTGADHPVAIPPVFVTAETSPSAVATAKAAGAEVHLIDYPDPRITTESMEVATGGDTIALGAQFGDSEHYAQAVDLADNGELPGGGGLVFPGRRMIALYGHPSGGALGLMGEQPPAESVARLNEYIEQYQPLEEQPVIPAFEIIVTVASEYPGDDGNYTNEFPVEDYIDYVDAITEAGGYAVLDLQPGRATFLEQAQLFEELLKRPNVGLALDPEWKIGPDQLPMQEIGHTDAAEVNEVADWLAELVRENDLPQKALVMHQFQSQMIRDREQINTSHPELAYVLHADGHGTPDLKFETWNVLQQGLSGEWFMAWKNFIDEDTPTFTPEQTYDTVDPRPWFVSYQ